MTHDHNKIRRAFRNEYLVPSVGLANTDWQWENRPFDADKKPAWGKETLLPAAERKSACGMIEFTGILQLDIRCPAGEGTEQPEKYAKALRDLFEPRGFTFEGQDFAIDRCETTSAQIDETWYMLPTFIYFRSYVFTN